MGKSLHQHGIHSEAFAGLDSTASFATPRCSFCTPRFTRILPRPLFTQKIGAQPSGPMSSPTDLPAVEKILSPPPSCL